MAEWIATGCGHLTRPKLEWDAIGKHYDLRLDLLG